MSGSATYIPLDVLALGPVHMEGLTRYAYLGKLSLNDWGVSWGKQ
jgi:hypothetical protein